ncbi:hypothetical protein F5B22DRAFT_610835, partial [Xylaria bambusicola]|uniref:uncharacterized protein n=1 Tax=Xylaria bambusicola TaxID=326684 RepID=UPI0020084E3A
MVPIISESDTAGLAHKAAFIRRRSAFVICFAFWFFPFHIWVLTGLVYGTLLLCIFLHPATGWWAWLVLQSAAKKTLYPNRKWGTRAIGL